MTPFFDVARELGIDLEELKREHPLHPDQLRNHKRITKRGEEYWAHERFLPRVEYRSQTIFSETPQPEPEKIPPKRVRVKRYEFTDQQLEIARRSLNAGGVSCVRVEQYESTERQLEIARRSLDAGGSV
jgi:hypothetical protein